MKIRIGHGFVVAAMMAAGCGGGGSGSGAGGSGVGGGGAGGGGAAAWLTPPSMPPAVMVPAGATIKIHDHAEGAQIYTCTASGGAATAVTYAWVLKAPDAKLYDASGAQVGTHGAGPSWTASDGSVANGTKVTGIDSPLPGAIPWLLLRVSSTTGTGAFSDVSYVQRLSTTGGAAPSTGCDATTVGVDTRVAYTAEYYFYTGGAGADWLVPPANLPAALAPPGAASLALHDRGIGVQIYNCAASGGGDGGADTAATTYAWVLKTPDATLYDPSFAPVATHGMGPSWTSSDGSTFTARVLAQVASPLADAIPWLLLEESSASGAGVFSDIAFVQRLNTAGGRAPATGCDATTVDTVTRVPYAADYYFYANGAGTGGVGAGN